MRGDFMEEIYGWVRGLVFYLILMTMVLNLLPDKKYEKYLRLFTGMIFIMLVFRPFMDLGGLEERMAGVFERITFQNDAKLLQRELKDVSETRLSRLVDGYRQAVELDIKTMAEGFSVVPVRVQVELETNPDSDGFGRLLSVELDVTVLDSYAENGTGAGRAGISADGEDTEEARSKRIEANREISRLRKKIGEYYGVEEGKIKIQLEDE